MVISNVVREVGIAALQGEHHNVLAVGLQILDAFQQGLGRRFGLLAAVIIDGSYDIVRVESLAIVELRALAKSKNPGLGAVGWLDAFGGIADYSAIRLNFGERCAERSPAEDPVKRVRPERRIKRVGRGAAAKADTELPALLGLGLCHFDKELFCRSNGQTGRNCVSDKVATRHSASGSKVLQFFNRHEMSSLSCC